MAKAELDASDQKASFDNHMAKAALDASDQKASFDNHMAKAELDASDQKASFDNQLAKAELDAGGMKVCACIYTNCSHFAQNYAMHAFIQIAHTLLNIMQLCRGRKPF